MNIINDVEDDNFDPLVDKIMQLQSCYIEGAAGTGKTTLINKIKEKITQNNESYLCLAPTNLAALLINGMTIPKYIAKTKNVIIKKFTTKIYIRR